VITTCGAGWRGGPAQPSTTASAPSRPPSGPPWAPWIPRRSPGVGRGRRESMLAMEGGHNE